jgi:hypothetical protein
MLPEHSKIITISGYLPLYKENKFIGIIFFGNISESFNNGFQIYYWMRNPTYNIKQLLFTTENL